MKKQDIMRLVKVLSGLLAALAVCFAFYLAVRNLHEDNAGLECRQLEKTVHRTVAACYAAEGRYPADLEYLRDNYGLIIDEEKYSVKYIAFADNMMPEITVLEKNK